MTDREAIQRLVNLVRQMNDHESANRIDADLRILALDLAEPAAPTVSQDYLDGVRAGLLEAARQDAEEIENAPTVTREQANWVLDALAIVRGNVLGAGRTDPLPVPCDATFFRSVADALEGE